MSIINEALKKAQDIGRKTESKVEERPVKLEVPPSVPLKKIGRSEEFTFKKFVFFIVFLFLVAGVFLYRNMLSRIPAPQGRPADFTALPIAPLPEENRVKPANADNFPSLTLNGIVYDEEKPYAIVNDRILLKGDMIDGATLIEVNAESVKFAFKDKELELKSK